MIRIFIVLALLAPACAIAQEAKSAQDRLYDALGLEWYLANCDQAQSFPAMTLMIAAMTINGSTVHDVETARETVRTHINSQWPSASEACAAFAAVQQTN